jgi:hypothetical protein
MLLYAEVAPCIRRYGARFGKSSYEFIQSDHGYDFSDQTDLQLSDYSAQLPR